MWANKPEVLSGKSGMSKKAVVELSSQPASIQREAFQPKETERKPNGRAKSTTNTKPVFDFEVETTKLRDYIARMVKRCPKECRGMLAQILNSIAEGIEIEPGN
jgi:hypothetical protein